MSMPMPAESAAGKLKNVADDRAVTDEAKRALRDLSTALDLGSAAALEPWAAVDLRAAFAPETTLKPPASAVWLGRSLDVLVFTPVASTWLGLTVAASAYKHTLNDPKLAGQNFLQRWQEGFDGHVWGGLSFGTVAAITFTLVAIVVAVAIGHFGFRARAEQGRQARAARRLSDALTAAEMELASVRLGAVGRVATEVGRVATEVAATAGEITKVGQAAERAQDAAGKTIDRITAAMAAVQAAAADVAQAVMDMGEKLAEATAATSSVAETEAEFGEKLLDATDRLDTTVAGLAGRLTTAVAAGQTELSKSVTESSQRVAESSQRVADSLDEGAKQVRGAIGELNTTATKNTGHMATAVASLGEVKDATGRLPTSLDELDTQVGRLNDGIGRLVRSIDSMAAAARRPAPFPSGAGAAAGEPGAGKPGPRSAGEPGVPLLWPPMPAPSAARRSRWRRLDRVLWWRH
jgi:hypothetical protein